MPYRVAAWVLEVGGVILVAVGLWWWSPSAALIFVGVAALVAAAALDPDVKGLRRDRSRQDRPQNGGG